MNGSKMSKSTGNVVDPFVAIHKYSADVLRFYLLRVGGNFANDADFKQHELDLKYSSTLKGLLGNLLSRISGKKIMDKLSNANPIDIHPNDNEEILHNKLVSLHTRFITSMDTFEMGKALETIEDTLHEVCLFIFFSFIFTRPIRLTDISQKLSRGLIIPQLRIARDVSCTLGKHCVLLVFSFNQSCQIKAKNCLTN